MKFVNRETQFPGKRRLIKVGPDNVPIVGEPEVLVNIVKEEGIVNVEGTPITAENLNKGNWRDDDSLSFKQRTDNALPDEEAEVTQLVTTANGETWIIPPVGSGQAKFKVDSIGTAVKINGIMQQDLNFTSDPQTQITTAKNTADAAHGTASAAQGTANSKSIVNVNGIKTDINFISDPQTQINGKADKVVTITTHEQLYLKDANGTQGMRDASSSVVNGAVPIRQSNGHISVPVTPSANADAASKQYVDAFERWVTVWDSFTGVGAGNQIHGVFITGGTHLRITVKADHKVISFLAYVPTSSEWSSNDIYDCTHFFMHSSTGGSEPTFACNYGIQVTRTSGAVFAKTWRAQQLSNTYGSWGNVDSTNHKVTKIEKRA